MASPETRIIISTIHSINHPSLKIISQHIIMRHDQSANYCCDYRLTMSI